MRRQLTNHSSVRHSLPLRRSVRQQQRQNLLSASEPSLPRQVEDYLVSLPSNNKLVRSHRIALSFFILTFPILGFGTAPAPSGGLFGTNNANPFGQSAPAPAATPFGGSLFGPKAPAPATGGLFGMPPAQQPGLGGSLGGGFGSSFGAPAQQQQQQQQTYAAYAVADDPLAFGSNPLFANSVPASARPVEEKKRPPIFTAFKGTPVNRSSTKITRLRGFGNTSTPGSSQSPLSFSTSVSGGAGTPTSSGRASPLRLANSLGDEAALSPNAFISRPGVKKLIINSSRSLGDSYLGKSVASPHDSSAPSKSTTSPSSSRKVSWNPETEVSTRQDSTFEESTPVKKSAGSNSNLGETEIPPRRTASAPVSSAPKHGAYWSSPPIEDLRKLPASALSAVANLVVGRVGYGEVVFEKPVDLTALNSVEDLFGELVSFQEKNVVVEKPLTGPATITLEGCWPLDKATRKPIRDPTHPRVQQHIKRLQHLADTKFIEYNDGRWSFEVSNF